MASRRFRLSLTAALVGVALTAMSGLAYAGALPNPAQGVASDVLDKVGVTLPASHNDAAADAGTAASTADDPSGDTTGTEDTGSSGDTTDTGDTSGTGDEGGSDSGDHGKGKLISQLAHDTPAPGKGKVISVVASGGKSHAGNPPGQADKGENSGSSHKPDHPDHPTGGNGHKHGGSGDHGNGS